MVQFHTDMFVCKVLHAHALKLSPMSLLTSHLECIDTSVHARVFYTALIHDISHLIYNVVMMLGKFLVYEIGLLTLNLTF